MQGNPFLRLLRREVEALVVKKHGHDYLKDSHDRAELTRIDRELKRRKAQIATLDQQKAQLMRGLGRPAGA